MSGGTQKPVNMPAPKGPAVSSRQVIWNGPNIECINLCKGDRIDDVVYKLACELCALLEMLDVTGDNYDWTCLNLNKCDIPTSFMELIQLLINKICGLLGTTGTPIQASEPTHVTPSCFTEELGGTVARDIYIDALGAKICQLENQLLIMQEAVNQLMNP